MSRDHVSHSELVHFAEAKVNLPSEKATEFREQAYRLRDRLKVFVAENPDFALRKIMLSGSLAKGTALRTINDIDLACYVEREGAPADTEQLMTYLAERLRKAFPNFSADQVAPKTYSVTVSFRGTGLDVDVVPVLYDGDLDWFGDLVSQEDGTRLKTNIPLHIEFIRRRKKACPTHFAQTARLLKFWARKLKQEDEEFRLKSFMIELILAHLVDDGLDFSDYPEALQHFFSFVARTRLRDLVAFSDHYPISQIPPFDDPVRIIDPINAANNVACLYSEAQADAIVNAALDAGDAIDAALAAPTKHDSVRYWQKVFGPTFQT